MTAPTPEDPGPIQGLHCRLKGCRCTHTDGCEAGWIALSPYVHPITRKTYAPVTACPICRPAAYGRYVQSITQGSVTVP